MSSKPADIQSQSSQIQPKSHQDISQLHSTPVYNRFQCLSDSTPMDIPVKNPPIHDVVNIKFKSARSERHKTPKIFRRSKTVKTKNDVKINIKPNPDLQTINKISDAALCGPKATINAQIFDSANSVLLDTGSQINAISQHVLPKEVLNNLAPSLHTITSYTGNEVDVMGTFITDVTIGKIFLTNCYFYVSRDNRKTIIGTPAIKENKIIINLAENHITQGKYVETLEQSQNTLQLSTSELGLTESSYGHRSTPPLQMQSSQSVTIPRKSTKFIEVSSRHPIDKTAYYATLDAFDHNIGFGILVAKSVAVLNPTKTTCFLRLCNVNDHDITIEPMRRIINLHAVETRQSPMSGSVTDDFEHNPAVINDISSTSNSAKLQQVISDIKIGSKDPSNISAVHKLISDNLDAFAVDDEPLGQTDKAIYDINTGNSAPVAQARYRTPYYLRNEMKKIIEKNVSSGLMEPCSSPYAAPVLLVKKQNGQWRLVCDYRKLNEVTVSDCYPLPEIENLVTNLSASKVFSSADLWTGFHQIPCSEEAKTKLAITTEFGQFTWLSMPMGGKNAPSVFQRLMDTVFRLIPRESLVIYLDDLLVHSLTEEDNIRELRRVLETLIANNLKIRASKTEVLMRKIKFCGYILENGSRKPNPAKVEAVQNLKPPSSRSGAQSIFGLLNYHRHFIPNFSTKASPITKTYKGHFAWTSDAQHALDTLKSEISNSALQLKIPDVNNAKFVLETDASKDGYGACLYICTTSNDHTHGSKCLRPVEYASRQFDQAQRNYSTFEKELLAGREVLRKWSRFLLGRKFVWRTDNACLQWAHKVRSRILKVSQWLAEISEYDILIERRPSATMKISDCLSRNFAELNSLNITKTDIRDLQASDIILERIRHYASIDRWPNDRPPEIETYFSRRDKLVFGTSGELLLKDFKGTRTLPPKMLIQDILKSYHDKNGHPGEKQTIDQLEKQYFWPTLTHDVKTYIHTCHKCQVTKPNLHPKIPPQGMSETPSGPWQMISWDLIGPLPITDGNHRYILTGFDLFSKRVYAIRLQTKTSLIIGNSIRRLLLQNPHMPSTILTDNGTEFATVSDICREFNMTHKTSPAYHPETNGGCERANQTLKNRLFCDDMETWDERLDQAVHSINCSKHSVTGLSPFAIETGNPGRNTHDFVEHSNIPQGNIAEHIQQTRNRIITEKTARFEKFNNQNFEPFAINDMVLARNMVSKFPRFLGPFKIIQVRGRGLSYLIRDLENGRQYTRHARQLKLYHPRTSQDNDQDYDRQDDNDRPPANDDPENSSQMDTSADVQINPVQAPIPTSTRQPHNDTRSSSVESSAEAAEPTLHPFGDNCWDVFRFNNSDDAAANNRMEFEDAPTNSTASNSDALRYSTTEATDNALDDTFHSTADTSIIDDSVTETYSEVGTIGSDDQYDNSYALCITALDKEQLLRIAAKYNLVTQGPVYDRIDQIDHYFKINVPDHPRNERGVLLFQPEFSVDRPKILTELSKNLCIALMKDYKMKRPFLYKTFTKDHLQNLIKSHLTKNFPDHPVDQYGNYIFTPIIHETARGVKGNNLLSS